MIAQLSFLSPRRAQFTGFEFRNQLLVAFASIFIPLLYR